MNERNSGLLLHITSLPGPEGTGTLGLEAFRFTDFLEMTGQKYWQILPVGLPGNDNSPYQCYSSFGGNPLLIDLRQLANDSLLKNEDPGIKPNFSDKKVDYKKVKSWKIPLLRKAHQNFKNNYDGDLNDEYKNFIKINSWWLNDYSLFMAAKKYFNDTDWTEWDEKLKYREKNTLLKYDKLLQEEISYHKFIQFLFFRQWFRLKNYANSKGILIFGDLPLYVLGDSCDVWVNPDIFQLGKDLKPTYTGGVPPDYFSATGQLWGNPLYDWKKLKKRKFDWWLDRLSHNFKLFDLVRIDHFRGLESYWSVPAGEKTAVNGHWEKAKGHLLLKGIKSKFGSLPVVAEDLGIITPEVDSLRNEFGLPGMKVLQFAFNGNEKNTNLPHNYTPECIAYTGTHDNNTTRGWLRSLKGKEKKQVRRYIGKVYGKRLNRCLEMVWSSCAKTAIMPVQDLLQLGEKARLNTPGTLHGNWEWRLGPGQLNPKHEKMLLDITIKYNRQRSAAP